MIKEKIKEIEKRINYNLKKARFKKKLNRLNKPRKKKF
jgi:hypothetical protein